MQLPIFLKHIGANLRGITDPKLGYGFKDAVTVKPLRDLLRSEPVKAAVKETHGTNPQRIDDVAGQLKANWKETHGTGSPKDIER